MESRVDVRRHEEYGVSGVVHTPRGDVAFAPSGWPYTLALGAGSAQARELAYRALRSWAKKQHLAVVALHDAG